MLVSSKKNLGASTTGYSDSSISHHQTWYNLVSYTELIRTRFSAKECENIDNRPEPTAIRSLRRGPMSGVLGMSAMSEVLGRAAMSGFLGKSAMSGILGKSALLARPAEPGKTSKGIFCVKKMTI